MNPNYDLAPTTSFQSFNNEIRNLDRYSEIIFNLRKQLKNYFLAFIVGRFSWFMLDFIMVFPLIFISLLSLSSFASDKYLVTATKLYIPGDDALSSVQIYTRNEIERFGAASVPDFLQSQTGIYFNSQGAYGGTQVLKQRGLSGFTKIILDDVELEDPSTISGAYQLQMINLDMVESIEVVQGPQSVLYGTDSVAGVIKINTRKDKKGSLSAGGGSDTTAFTNAYFSTKLGRLNYYFSGSYKQTEGISSFSKNKTYKAERDSFRIIQLNPSLLYQFNTKSKLYISLHSVNSTSEIDQFSSDLSQNDKSTFDNGRITVKYQNRIFKDHWEYKLIYSQSDIKRFVEVPSDSDFKSTKRKIDFQNLIFWNKNLNSLFGIDYEYNEATAEGSFDDFNKISVEASSFYTTQVINLNKLISETSFRFQKHQRFDDVNTYKQAFLIRLGQFDTLKASYGHSFRSPTLYQLSSTLYGDLSLNPTRIHSYELGWTHGKKSHLSSLTYFNNSLTDYIGFSNFLNKYENIGRAKTQGIEAIQSINFEDSKISFNYTYTDVEDETTNVRVSRIPKEKLTISHQFVFLEKIKTELSSLYVGRRLDSSAGPEMPSYALLNVSFQFSRDKIDYQLYIHNLLNKDYEDSFNFGTRGLSAYAWVKTTF